jgi:hypothetical protein
MDVISKEDDADCVTATLFDRLAETLCDSLGCAAAVALLRRSRRRAATRYAELAEVGIERVGAGYVSRLPDSWHRPSPKPLRAFCAWLEELVPFLVELTGLVVIRRLAAIPEFERWRVLSAASSSTKDGE